jgi:hypothetical protein
MTVDIKKSNLGELVPPRREVACIKYKTRISAGAGGI